MPNARTDPFPRYQFLVEIEGIARAGFMTVSGLEEETEVRFPDGGPSFYVMVHHSKSRYGGPGYAALVLPERPA